MAAMRQYSPARKLRVTGQFGLLTVLCVLYLFGAPVQAIAQESLTISETARSMSVDPGGVLTGSFTAVNQSSDPAHYAIKAVPYRVRDADYQPDFSVGPQDKNGANSWVSFNSENPVEVAPKGVYEVRYRITVPTTAEPGGYSFVIFVEPVVGNTGTSLALSARAGNIIYLTVNGAARAKGVFMGSPVPVVSLNNQFGITPSVANEGRAHMTAVVGATVTNMFGKTVWQEAAERKILPGTQRRFQFAGNVTPLFGMGVYKVAQHASFGNSDKALKEQWMLIVTPLGIATLGIVLGIMAVVWRMRKRGKA